MEKIIIIMAVTGAIYLFSAFNLRKGYSRLF